MSSNNIYIYYTKIYVIGILGICTMRSIDISDVYRYWDWLFIGIYRYDVVFAMD